MKLSDDQVRAIRWLVEMGVPLATLGHEYGVSTALVSFVATGRRRAYVGGPIRTSPITFTRKTLTREQASEVRELRNRGWKVQELAKKFDVSTAAISRICAGASHREK